MTIRSSLIRHTLCVCLLLEQYPPEPSSFRPTASAAAAHAGSRGSFSPKSISESRAPSSSSSHGQQPQFHSHPSNANHPAASFQSAAAPPARGDRSAAAAAAAASGIYNRAAAPTRSQHYRAPAAASHSTSNSYASYSAAPYFGQPSAAAGHYSAPPPPLYGEQQFEQQQQQHYDHGADEPDEQANY